MATLQPEECPTVAEMEARLIKSGGYSAVDEVLSFLPHISQISQAPSSNAPNKLTSTPSCYGSKDVYKEAFLNPPSMTLDKNKPRLILWLEGICKKILTEDSGQDEKSGIASKLMYSMFHVLSKAKDFMSPYSPISPQDYIENFTTTRDWKNSSVRALKWHPQTSKLALAMFDDSIQIYCLSLVVSPILKYKLQKSVSCLAWRPFSSSELAVGTESGVLIWTVDPSSVVARPSASCVSKLNPGWDAPVTSLEYDSRGKYLMVCSPADKAIIVWDTWSEEYVRLKRLETGGCHMAVWSPCGRFALSASSSTKIRLWNILNKWKDEAWNVKQGYVNSAAWSPCGDYLIFSTNEDNQLFCINFAATGGRTSAAVPIADLQFDNCESAVVQMIKWDNFGERLVVSFLNSNRIASFCTTNRPTLNITPIGFIYGEPEEFPTTMDFHNKTKMADKTVLTIAWSSGRIQHLPMIFNSSLKDTNNTLDGTVHGFKPELFSSPLL